MIDDAESAAEQRMAVAEAIYDLTDLLFGGGELAAFVDAYRVG